MECSLSLSTWPGSSPWWLWLYVYFGRVCIRVRLVRACVKSVRGRCRHVVWRPCVQPGWLTATRLASVRCVRPRCQRARVPPAMDPALAICSQGQPHGVTLRSVQVVAPDSGAVKTLPQCLGAQTVSWHPSWTFAMYLLLDTIHTDTTWFFTKKPNILWVLSYNWCLVWFCSSDNYIATNITLSVMPLVDSWPLNYLDASHYPKIQFFMS